MKQLSLSCISILFAVSSVIAQYGYLQKTFGGTGWDYGRSVQQTTDGGYIIAGYTSSFGAGNEDVYLIKTDANSNIMWTKTYGGTNDDRGYSVQQTTDGGYIITGYTNSFGAGGLDFYLIKTNSSGDALWTKTYGGPNEERCYSVQQTVDGGYIMTGYTESFGAGNKDVYLVKTDDLGDTLWTKTFGGTDWDGSRSVQQTTDGGYIITGTTESFGVAARDVYLIKTNSSGNVTWTRTYGGSGIDNGFSVQQTADGGYIIAGSVDFGGGDVYLIKTNDLGDTLWTKTYGGASWDFAYSVQQTTDGGYIVGGITNSFGTGGDDIYLIKTNSIGDTLWTRSYGGTNYDDGYSVQQTADGGYVVVGNTISFATGGVYVYLIKADANGNVGCNQYSTSTIVNTPPTQVGAFSATVGSGGTVVNAPTTVTDPATFDSVLCSFCGFPPKICMVTVDTTSTRNLIVWEKAIIATIDSFRIYRDIVGTYTHIGSVPYGALSEFVDSTNGVNPQVTSYRYKISIVDTCGFESDLSAFHETMHLTISQGIPAPALNLIWDTYEGFSFDYYRIWRDSTNGTNYQLLDSVSISNFTYTDPTPPLGNVSYLVTVAHPSGCTSDKKSKDYNESKSNTQTFSTIGFDELKSEDLRLEVYPNPTSGVFTIKVSGSGLNVSWEVIVFDILGQEIIKSQITNHKSEINMKGYPSGIYQIRVTTDKRAGNKKILIQ